MPELTWQDLDRLEAERAAKKRDLCDRLTRILSNEFSLNELRLLFSFECEPQRIEAYERARVETKK